MMSSVAGGSLAELCVDGQMTVIGQSGALARTCVRACVRERAKPFRSKPSNPCWTRIELRSTPESSVTPLRLSECPEGGHRSLCLSVAALEATFLTDTNYCGEYLVKLENNFNNFKHIF